MIGNKLFLIGTIIVIIVIVSSIIFCACQVMLASKLKKKIRNEYGSKPVR